MRVSVWDKWKGAAIIAVVLIHASGSTANFPISSFNNEFGFILRQLINFPVGLFIFLAAFFVASSTSSTESYWISVKKRVWRLALPFLIWSFIYFGMKLIRGSLAIEEIPLKILNGTSVAVGYFVIVMIQMSIISPFLERLNFAQLAKLLPISFLLSISTTYTLKLVFPESVLSEFPYYPLPFFIWLPFYIGGLIVGKKNEVFWRNISVWGTLGVYLICVCLSVAESMLFLQEMRGFATSQLKATSMLTTSAVCLMVIASWVHAKDNKENMLSWLGQRSFYFYLSHMLVLWEVKSRLGGISELYDNQIAFVFLLTVTTLAITTVGAIIIDRVFSRNSFYRRALGLA